MFNKIIYSTRTEGQGQEKTKIHTLRWWVPNLKKLADKTIQEFRPEYKPTGECIESDCRFKVHMQFMGKEKDLISINYLYAILIKNAFLKLIDYKLPNVMVFGEYNEIVLCNFPSYTPGEEANKWHRMCTLNSSCLPDLPKLLVQIVF